MITTPVISTTSTTLSTRKAAQRGQQQELRMSSLDIAELCGKQHFHVMEAIRKMEPAWEKVSSSKFRLSSRKVIQPNGGVREFPCYELTKTETLYIATKFKDEERAKLVLRWEELERERLEQGRLQKPREIRLLATAQEVLHESEEIVGGQLDIANEESDGCFTVTQIADVLNMSAHDLNSFLLDQKIQRWAGGQYRLTPQYAELDLAANRLSVGYSLKGKLKYNTYLVWTEKGRDFILDLVKFRR
jgi:phage regulator Rha-like protein